MTLRGLIVALLFVAACSRQPEQVGSVPVPSDWGQLAPELRPLVEQAVARCRRDPRDAEALAALGRLYHGNGAPSLAAEAYQQALALTPRDAKTIYFLGLIREEAGATDAALSLLQRAREIEPSYAPLRHHLGSVLLDAARPQEAVVEFREAIRLDPREPAFGVGLARALKQSGSPEEALAAVQGALRVAPDDPAANQVAALVLKELGRDAGPHLAKGRLYRAGVVRDPWFRDVQMLGATAAGALARAEFLLEAGKGDQAIRVLEPVAAANPGRADVLRALGHARALGGQLPRAKDDYLRALAAAPHDAQVHAELASILLDLGDLDGAARHASEAIAADAAIVSARVVLAQVKLKKGDAAAALADLAPVIEAHPDDLLAHVVRGDALLALGQASQAAGAFEAALRIQAGFEYAKRRLAEARAAGARAESR